MISAAKQYIRAYPLYSPFAIPITKTYDILNVNLKTGIQIHPAGEWLLDNYYIIEETVKGIIKELPLKKYKNFIGIAKHSYHFLKVLFFI